MSQTLPRQFRKVRDSLFPEGIKLILIQQAPGIECLSSKEQELIQGAHPNRQASFTGGRWCAKQALAQFGIRDTVLLMDEEGRTVWPAGFTGSISHCKNMYGAAVCRTDEFTSLGFDAEVINRKLHERQVLKHICTPEELSQINDLPENELKPRARLIFSAKESVYKCLSNSDCRPISYRSLHISFNFAGGVFTAELSGRSKSILPDARLPGRFLVIDGFVLTGTWAEA